MDDDAVFCTGCGAAITENAVSNNGKDVTSKRKHKWVLTAALIGLVLAVFIAVHFVAYSGYETFLDTYLEAVGAGDREAILACHRWEYVCSKMEDNKKNSATAMFVWEDLEDYVSSNDELYDARVMGKKIRSWEITDSSRNYFTVFDPSMWVEVYLDLDGTSDDVIAVINMKKGNDGWYITHVDAAWASVEADD